MQPRMSLPCTTWQLHPRLYTPTSQLKLYNLAFYKQQNIANTRANDPSPDI